MYLIGAQPAGQCRGAGAHNIGCRHAHASAVAGCLRQVLTPLAQKLHGDRIVENVDVNTRSCVGVVVFGGGGGEGRCLHALAKEN